MSKTKYRKIFISTCRCVPVENENVIGQVKRNTRSVIEELQDRAVKYYRAIVHKNLGDDAEIKIETSTKPSRSSIRLIIVTRWKDVTKNEHKEA